MNEIVQRKSLGAVSDVFRSAGNSIRDDLGAGVQGGFAIISYRGKNWRIKHQGSEVPVLRNDGDGPADNIEVVIVKAAENLSKIWYEKQYTPGSTTPPDCFSTNGITPDPASPKLQNNMCKPCRWNQFGTANNGKGKACMDSKRLAVVPAGDLHNEIHGGPMLLRVPATSLTPLKQYGINLDAYGIKSACMVATRISFNPEKEHPEFVFRPIRALNDEEAKVVMQLRESDQVDRIINVAVDEMVNHEPEVKQPEPEPKKEEHFFEQPETLKAPQKAHASQIREKAPERPVLKSVQSTPQAPKPAPRAPQEAKKPAPAPAPLEQEESVPQGFDDALDDELEALLPK
jgi:hypothetical protein